MMFDDRIQAAHTPEEVITDEREYTKYISVIRTHRGWIHVYKREINNVYPGSKQFTYKVMSFIHDLSSPPIKFGAVGQLNFISPGEFGMICLPRDLHYYFTHLMKHYSKYHKNITVLEVENES